MTKEEYADFVLRYKGCGACFPMYHTLSRFEKMWFSAIQKDVAELEKENAELSMKRKAERKIFQGIVEKKNDQLTKAKEIIREFMKYEINEYDGSLEIHFEELKKHAEQFLNCSEKPNN